MNRFAALKADTDVFTTFEGDNHVLLQLVAKGLLTDYASDFEDLDQLGMVRFVAGLAVETVIERTTVHKLLERVRDLLPGGDEWDQEAGLLDPEYQLAMLRFREEHMLAGVARRLKRGIDHEHEPRRGLLPRSRTTSSRAARAHVERLVLEAFVEKVARAADDGDNKVALEPALRPLRAVDHRGRPGLVHGARPAHRASAPRRSAARSTACAARSGRSPSTWSTRSACPTRCCARRSCWAEATRHGRPGLTAGRWLRPRSATAADLVAEASPAMLDVGAVTPLRAVLLRRTPEPVESGSVRGGVLLGRSNDAWTSASASVRPTHSAPSTDLPGSRSL